VGPDRVVPDWVGRTRTDLLRPRPALALFGVAAVIFFAWTQKVGLGTAPARDMGDLQKILYVHVPTAWIAFVSFFVVLVAGVWYLATRAAAADRLGASAAEVGTLLNGLVLVQGMIWAKPTWDVWWTWDPRLSSTLVLFLIFTGISRCAPSWTTPIAARAGAHSSASSARWACRSSTCPCAGGAPCTRFSRPPPRWTRPTPPRCA
jgi:ABC-type transport system involved in cytochrome c biogenesis permease subunit